jgi:DNA-binding HxlR family transcriptional regulator
MSDPEFQFPASIWRMLGRRWTIAILQNLSAIQARRFTELKKSLRVSSTMLSQRLQELEREGLVSKQIYDSVPPKVEYRLTPRATELQHIMEGLRTWHARREPEKAHELGMNPIAL